MANLDGTDDTFDSREVIERIAEIEATEVIDRVPGEQDELDALYAFRDDAEGYISDWQYGETFISDEYFPEYVGELCTEVGYLPVDLPYWIANHINWDGVADELKPDYTSFEFRGTTYWARG